MRDGGACNPWVTESSTTWGQNNKNQYCKYRKVNGLDVNGTHGDADLLIGSKSQQDIKR